jgi:D-glycero-alpha-D-manno-heptose-7-phosphate kinase
MPHMMVEASAPCRLDMGGTLDIPGFYLTLRHFRPVTLNMALKMRTRVRVKAYRPGRIRISAGGIETADFPTDSFPYHHPLGLMAATARFFNIDGVEIEIASGSPPRSGLGGSSVAAVALVQALGTYGNDDTTFPVLQPEQVAEIARSIEAAVAGVPCGGQDHLAAAFGGVHLYHWGEDSTQPGAYRKTRVVAGARMDELTKHLQLVYTGVQHVSGDINGQWVSQYMIGEHRDVWAEIITLTHRFSEALSQSAYREAGDLMNREVALRRQMTPQVLNPDGMELIAAAEACKCGARFTGAGAGGCIWALGEEADMERLAHLWKRILAGLENAEELPVALDPEGVLCNKFNQMVPN